MDTPECVVELAARLRTLGWVTDLLVGGSVATDDYRAGVSDLDLVALTDLPIDGDREAVIVALHQELDATVARGATLGCAYVEASLLHEVGARHPTCTHGGLARRTLSGVARAELVRHGFSVLGRPPQDVLPSMSNDDVRRAAHAELTGYWAMAARRPWWWLDPRMADLGLTSMARGRYAHSTGELLTKTSAIDLASAPEWLRRDLRARRNGRPVRSPRLITAWCAWRDARKTTRAARRWNLPG